MIKTRKNGVRNYSGDKKYKFTFIDDVLGFEDTGKTQVKTPDPKDTEEISDVVDYVLKNPEPKEIERTIVYVRKNRSFPFEKHTFSLCLFDYFDIESNEFGYVECFIEKNKVFVQLPESSRLSFKKSEKWHRVYRLEHPVFCAVHRLSDEARQNLPEEISTRGMDVGVSVILESLDSKVLLTRRGYHMRTFPGVWVSPGGHIEKGENFKDAGLREVLEETGLEVGDVNCRILGLWESVFPSVLYEGEPKRHHLVIYLGINLQKSSKELQESIRLDPEEVDASMWLSEDIVALAVEGGVSGYYEKMINIPITRVHKDGTQTMGLLDPKVLRKKMPAPDRIVERLSTGTRFALRRWLNCRRGLD